MQGNLKVAFGRSVRSMRNRLGISQDELAWRASVHRTYVTNIERGICNPSLGSIQKLASALGTSMSTLLGDLEGKDPKWARGGGSSVDILVIEDNPTDAVAAVNNLKQWGLVNEIRVVQSAELALEFIIAGGFEPGVSQAERPMLILLDLQLPGISGIELLQRLKSNRQTASIPLVILTSSLNERDVIECRRLGADAYLAKPLDFKRLIQVTPKLNLSWLLCAPSARAQ